MPCGAAAGCKGMAPGGLACNEINWAAGVADTAAGDAAGAASRQPGGGAGRGMGLIQSLQSVLSSVGEHAQDLVIPIEVKPAGQG